MSGALAPDSPLATELAAALATLRDTPQATRPDRAAATAALRQTEGALDRRTGAPSSVRFAVGAAPSDPDRLATLRRHYPDAEPYGDGNFVFTNPRTGRVTLYNPPGPDFGDAASLAPEAGEIAGGVVGGAAAVAAAPTTLGQSLWAVPAGVGLGAAAGRRAVQASANLLGTTVDTRGPVEAVVDDATTAGVNAAAVPVGALLGRGVRAALGEARPGVNPAERLRDFAEAGVPATVADVTGGRGAAVVEAVSGNTLGGAGVMQRAAEGQRASLATEHARLAASLGTPMNPVEAGRAVQAGARAGIAERGARQRDLYDDAFNRIGADTAVTANLPTLAALRTDLAARVAEAPETMGRTLAPVLREVDGLLADAGRNLTFGTFRRARTDLRLSLASRPPGQTLDATDTARQALYDAMTADMRVVAGRASPAAERAMMRADRYTAATADEITGALPVLQEVATRDTPEEAWRLVQSWASGNRSSATELARLRASMPRAAWGDVQATLLHRAGMANPGAATGAAEAGGEFSAATLLTNLNRMRANPAAFKAAFGGQVSDRAVEELARLERVLGAVRQTVREGGNPSGTGRAAAGLGFQGGIGAAVLGGVSTGTLPAGAGALLAAVPTSYAGARLMTNPRFVRWMASTASGANRPEIMAQQLARLGAVAEAEPELRTLIEGYRTAVAGSLATTGGARQ